MALVTFYQIFRFIDNDTLMFINNTKVGSLYFPANSILKRGLVVAGIDFFNFVGNNMEVTTDAQGNQVIERIYVK